MVPTEMTPERGSLPRLCGRARLIGQDLLLHIAGQDFPQGQFTPLQAHGNSAGVGT